MITRRFATDHHQPQRQRPEYGKSPTATGVFAVLVEILGASMLLGIGVHFVTIPSEPFGVGVGALGLTAILLIDGVRRLVNIARGKARI